MYNLRNRKTRKLTKRCGYGCNCGELGKQKHSGKNMHAAISLSEQICTHIKMAT